MKNSAYDWTDTIRELTSKENGVDEFLEELIDINENSDSPVIVENCTFKNNSMVEEYNRGYEDVLRAIKINLEHFKKDVYSIEMIYEGCDIDRYEGESACEKLLFSEILGVDK